MTPTANAIVLAVEDVVSEAVAQRLVAHCLPTTPVATCLRRNGFGYLKDRIHGLNDAAQGMPYFILVDLDQCSCPPVLLRDWFQGRAIHGNMVFRIAVRQVEAWLLADRAGIARFLQVAQAHVPTQPESQTNAKQALVNVARRSRSRHVRQDIVPGEGMTAPQGPNYNSRLVTFVHEQWDLEAARSRADSLDRAIRRLGQRGW
jgi:hypothetical protein